MSDADIQTVEVTSRDSGEDSQMELIAKLAAQKLSQHYPAHLWMVGWAPGMALIIKNMAMDPRYGYSIDAAKAHSISELEHAIMIAGGEILERMGMSRGAWDGEMPTQIQLK